MNNKGFTLIEVLVVIAIIAILSAIAYPSYQNYLVRTYRTEMMSELQNIGKQIETRKLAAGHGGYKAVDKSMADLLGDYPRTGGSPMYTVTVSDIEKGKTWTETGNWALTATPKAGSTQIKDGDLVLKKNGQKCRGTVCGMSDEWKQ